MITFFFNSKEFAKANRIFEGEIQKNSRHSATKKTEI